ncbi:MAG TPA: GH1 family beta-glucosidase [Propionibacteriaceae bacterium]|nr:GH1 family beta-glucosidase [Propionibacteriaceae bacterium]
MSATRTFPQGFTWGTATASYQVEGAVGEDGRTPSIWDTMAHTPGGIVDGSNGDVSVDEYHRYPEDIALMTELGVTGYRFSISWPRNYPEPGTVNQAGIDHYKRLAEALLDAGITPLATLYHWDLPQYLEDAGGWPNRGTAYRYAEYVSTTVSALGSHISTWGTLNEPWCSAFLGYADGEHAPGRHDHPAALAAAHHLNLAHGLGVQAIRAAQTDSRVSVSLNLHALRAASDSAEDRAALAQCERVGNGIWLKPMLEGHYDPQLFEDTAHVTDWSFVQDGDLREISQPLDFLGLNYYSTSTVRRIPGAVTPTWVEAHSTPWVGPFPGTETIEFLPPTGPLTAMGWNQEPEALTELLVGLHRSYPELDLVVTENGAAFDDELSPNEDVHDPRRTAYYRAHIEAVGKAIDEGAPVKGYYAWSLLDNFEWAWGYTKRFGLFYVDYPTQARIWKDTGRWYAELARTNTLPALAEQV